MSAAATVSEFIRGLSASETWRPVAGYPNYEISSFGNVRRISSRRILKRCFVAGYAVVSLCGDDGAKNHSIHAMVARAFLGEPPFDGAMAAHNDGDKSRCVVSNIRWASALENQRDRVRHGTDIHGSAVFGAKLTETDIPLIRSRIDRGERFPPIARDFGVSVSTISLIKKGRIWRRAQSVEGELSL